MSSTSRLEFLYPVRWISYKNLPSLLPPCFFLFSHCSQTHLQTIGRVCICSSPFTVYNQAFHPHLAPLRPASYPPSFSLSLTPLLHSICARCRQPSFLFSHSTLATHSHVCKSSSAEVRRCRSRHSHNLCDQAVSRNIVDWVRFILAILNLDFFFFSCVSVHVMRFLYAMMFRSCVLDRNQN